MRFFFSFLVAAFFALGGFFYLNPSPEEALKASCETLSPTLGFSPDALESLKTTIQNEIDQKHIGSAVALISRCGEDVFFETFGQKGDAIMRLASAGKIVTALEVMILMEKGMISLDDPVAKFIPEFTSIKIKDEGAEDLVFPKRPILIRDLLTHTGGLDVTSGEFEEIFYVEGEEGTTLTLALKMATLPLLAEPGTQFEYGFYGASYEVLAAVLEKASGRKLDELFEEDIFAPLGLKDTYFWVPEVKQKRIPAIYQFWNGKLNKVQERGLETEPNAFLSGGGGLRSTVLDFQKIAQLIFNQGEIEGINFLKPETIDLMTSDHLGVDINYGKDGYGWGYGFRVQTTARPDGVGSPGALSWNGGTGVVYFIDPQEQLFGILVFPSSPPPYSALYNLFEKGMYESLTVRLGESG